MKLAVLRQPPTISELLARAQHGLGLLVARAASPLFGIRPRREVAS